MKHAEWKTRRHRKLLGAAVDENTQYDRLYEEAELAHDLGQLVYDRRAALGLQAAYFVAELTGLNTREGWPDGTRLIVRRVKPSGRQIKKLTGFERKTGWRYSITATNIGRMWGIAGSHQPQFLDVLHRDHAEVEDRVRTNKAMGLHNLPSKSWDVNRGWMLAANLAADLDAWLRLLGLHDVDDLADAEIDTMRFRLYHLPARLTKHARCRWLRIDSTWPWAKAFTVCRQRLTGLPALT